ncbi:MAG: ribonuclease III [Bryobacteraceae bacterium]
MPADLQVLEASLGRPFANRELLIRALTHKSLCFEKKPGVEAAFIDNEQLEFLGDSILGFVVSECLIRRYPDYPEGRLSKLKAHLVSAAHLYLVAQALDLGAFLHLGRGEEMSGGRAKRALLANALEAIIAAIYLDAGMEAARDFIVRKMVDEWSVQDSTEEDRVADYKTALQERAQVLSLPQPRYIIAQENGPEHAKTFVVEVRVGSAFSGRGEGPSKKAAGQSAAKSVLQALK